MMFKKMVLTLLLCSVATLAIVACGGTGNSTSTPASATDQSASRNEVHMSAQDFVQSSVTISKGSSIILVDDGAVPHEITNGTWDNGSAKTLKEAGVPVVHGYTPRSNVRKIEAENAFEEVSYKHDRAVRYFPIRIDKSA